MHMSEMVNARSVVAQVNGKTQLVRRIKLVHIALVPVNVKFVMAQEQQGMTTINEKNLLH